MEPKCTICGDSGENCYGGYALWKKNGEIVFLCPHCWHCTASDTLIEKSRYHQDLPAHQTFKVNMGQFIQKNRPALKERDKFEKIALPH
jgi:hypothetical protein